MPFQLDSEIRYCVTNGRAAFLNLRNDRYFCLPPDLDAAFQDIAREDVPPSEDATAVAALIRTGIVAPSTNKAITVPIQIPRPERDCAGAADGGTSLFDFAFAALCYGIAKLEVRHRGLKQIITRLNKASSQANAQAKRSPEDLARCVATYARIRAAVRVHDQCLIWSLGLMRYLSSRGFHPRFVIGMKLEPFSAHAWVQADELVLSCPVDEARLYTPIVAV